MTAAKRIDSRLAKGTAEPISEGSVLLDYDRVRIVSLPERDDRRRQMRRELRSLGVEGDTRVQFFNALKRPDRGPFRSAGSHGCYLSHLAILRDAAQAEESVLILQDDCEFLPDTRSYRLPPGVDVFYGGYEASDPDDLANCDIVGAHFMGFSAKAAGLASNYLTQLLDPSFPPDAKAAAESSFNPTMRPPIDGACVWFRRAHPELVTEFRLLAVQRSSRSDITPRRTLDRFWATRGLLEGARRLKRFLRAR